jgi:hypothetical protein
LMAGGGGVCMQRVYGRARTGAKFIPSLRRGGSSRGA